MLSNALEISKKHWNIIGVVGNFEDIISSFWEISDKREILEKT